MPDTEEWTFDQQHSFPHPFDVTLNGGTTRIRSVICPDLLTINQLGAADSMRGHLVRAFFSLLRWLP